MKLYKRTFKDRAGGETESNKWYLDFYDHAGEYGGGYRRSPIKRQAKALAATSSSLSIAGLQGLTMI